MIKSRLAVSICASLLFSGAALAADEHGHEHAKGHEHGGESHTDVKGPETVPAAWTMIAGKLTEIDAAAASKAFDAAHPAVDQLEAAVHVLETKSDMVTAENKTKLASALKQLDKSVDALHHSVEDKNADEIAAASQKIKTLLPLIAGLYPAGTLN